MIAAAKEEMLSSFAWCADPALAADLFPKQPRLAVRTFNPRKPHQGVTSRNPALHQGQPVCNSTIALGMRGLAALTRVGSRCTGKERDTETGLDYFGARYYGSNMGRFMSPDPLGGHLEDPQTLNRYVYVRNNPLNLTDPTGLDFYLTCKEQSSTCQSQTVGYDKNGNAQTALVQGFTNSDKSFTATQIGNDKDGNLVDKTTGTGAYSANVSKDGVSFSQDGGKNSSAGVFVNGTAATTIQGSGDMKGFTFTFTNSKLEANQTAAGTFNFNGTPEQAGLALQNAGFHLRLGGNAGYNEYRSSGHFPFGRNAAHFNVMELGVPGSKETTGNMHFGEHDPFYNLGGLIGHCVSDGACF